MRFTREQKGNGTMNHLSLSSGIAALLLAFGPLPAANAQEAML